MLGFVRSRPAPRRSPALAAAVGLAAAALASARPPGGGLGEIRGVRSMTNPDVKADPTHWTTVRTWLLDCEGPDEHRRRQI